MGQTKVLTKEQISLLAKVPPHDIITEEAVLQTIIDEPAGFITIAKYFNPDIFYNEKCRIIAEAIYQLNDENIPIDILSVTRKILSFKDKGSVTPYDVSHIGTSHHAGYFAHNLDSWFRILIEYYIRREMINISADYAKKAYDLSHDSLILASEMAEKVSRINNISLFKHSYNSTEAVDSLLKEIEVRDKSAIKYYSIGIPELDKYIRLDVGDLILLAGAGGSGKSKLTMSMVKHLLLHYNNFACQYFSFEDKYDTVMLNWLAEAVMLSPSEMKSKGWLLSENDKMRIKREAEVFKMFDFQIVNDTCKINDIKTAFKTFCNERPNKFNLLVIDNVMLLHDNQTKEKAKTQTDVDEGITTKIQEIREATIHNNSAVIILHHFTKDAMNGKNRLFTGYKPEVTDIRGSTRYNDIMTKTLLINSPFIHKDLVACYPGYEEMIRDLMIIEVAKCRDGANGFVRLFTKMEYNIFKVANSNESEAAIAVDMRKKKRDPAIVSRRNEMKKGIII